MDSQHLLELVWKAKNGDKEAQQALLGHMSDTQRENALRILEKPAAEMTLTDKCQATIIGMELRLGRPVTRTEVKQAFTLALQPPNNENYSLLELHLLKELLNTEYKDD